MKLENIPFSVTDWASVEPTEHPGDSGVASLCGARQSR